MPHPAGPLDQRLQRSHAELSPDRGHQRDPPARRKHASHLVEGGERIGEQMQGREAAHAVEAPVAKRELGRVAPDQRQVAQARVAQLVTPRSSIVRRRIDSDHEALARRPCRANSREKLPGPHATSKHQVARSEAEQQTGDADLLRHSGSGDPLRPRGPAPGASSARRSPGRTGSSSDPGPCRSTRGRRRAGRGTRPRMHPARWRVRAASCRAAAAARPIPSSSAVVRVEAHRPALISVPAAAPARRRGGRRSGARAPSGARSGARPRSAPGRRRRARRSGAGFDFGSEARSGASMARPAPGCPRS